MIIKHSTLVWVSCHEITDDLYAVSFTRWYDVQVNKAEALTKSFHVSAKSAGRLIDAVRNLPSEKVDYFYPALHGWGMRLEPEEYRVFPSLVQEA